MAAIRATSITARARTASTASPGTTPASAHAAIAAISTSSHRWNRRSSDQTAPMAGRVYRGITGIPVYQRPFWEPPGDLQLGRRRPALRQDLGGVDRGVSRAVDGH